MLKEMLKECCVTFTQVAVLATGGDEMMEEASPEVCGASGSAHTVHSSQA